MKNVTVIQNLLKKTTPIIVLDDAETWTGDIEDTNVKFIANAVFEQTFENDEEEGMGTVADVMSISVEELVEFWVNNH